MAERGVTIFTPTYNRAHTLPRLYKSLVEQNSGDFEWLIVDDGSVDHTKELIDCYIQEGKVQIRYIYKKNGGKHTAINIGIKNAEKEYFFCVDSDDYLEKDAVFDIMECVDRQHPDGIIAYKREEQNTGIIGNPFPDELHNSTLFNLINNYSCSGDRSLIYSTECIRNIFIPEPEGVKFFPETYMYDRFDEKHTCFLLRKSLCICEYLDGGYSSDFRQLMIDNALSMKWFYAERIDMDCTIKQRYMSAFRYIAFCLIAKRDEGKYIGNHRFVILAAIPFGIAMYIRYSIYRKKRNNEINGTRSQTR